LQRLRTAGGDFEAALAEALNFTSAGDELRLAPSPCDIDRPSTRQGG
jgi:hypothetical protein